MQRLAAVLIVLVMADHVLADPPATSPPDIRATIDRGLAFLAKDAVAWKTEYKCASCHHAALAIWALREAKDRGHAVDEPVLADLTKWIAESGEGKTGVPRPAGIPRAHNTKAVYFALGLAAIGQPSDAERQGRARLLGTVKADQIEDGSWASWTDTRPPLFGHSDENATALATLALWSEAAAGEAAAVAARDRGLKWLAEHEPSGDHQALALRIVLLKKADQPSEQWQPLLQRLQGTQQPDGGWRQTAEMASDAHATGQALYALALAGRKSEDPAVQRGQAFLIKTQGESGSWTMTSRPTKLGGEGAKNLVPITGAGNAWAILGLVRSTE